VRRVGTIESDANRLFMLVSRVCGDLT